MAAGLLLQRRRRGSDQPLGRYRDVIPCYLSVQGHDLRIQEVNELFIRDFGDRIGEKCFAAYKGRTSPCPNCPVLLTLEDGKVHTGEEVVITKDGQVAHVVVTSAPIRDPVGKLVGSVEMSTNVTELRALREELDKSRSELENLFDIVPCYITVQDRNYRIIQSNQAFRRDFGDRKQSHCFAAYKGRESRCAECPVEKTFADGEVHSGEEVVVTRDGREAEVIIYSMPIHDEKGEISAVMEVSTNITEVKRLQRQLVMMGLAVAGMAHRTKNIIMGLEGGIFVVNDGLETDDRDAMEEGWRMVERNVSKVSRVVKDLLLCAKEREPDFRANTSPPQIVREVHELYRDRMAAEDIEFVLDGDIADHQGTFDPDGIYSVVSNLVANALDACSFDTEGAHKQHRIVVHCGRDSSDAAIIEVSDNGAGIPDGLSDKVFQSFFSTKGTEGTGLGLLVVQKVVEECGGSITFTSQEGEGTTFRVVLPDQRTA
ncbi:MAG: PAS domain-containing protein [Deltaproteobacteria bacterium]|nr:PAS domain-containing protein [Deltaproteobacteria bacterium]